MIDRTSNMIKCIGDYALTIYYDVLSYQNIDGIFNNNAAEKGLIEDKVAADCVTLVPNTAVLVIDMQGSFLKGMDEKLKKALIDSQVEILRYCAEYDIPIIIIEYADSVLPWSKNIEYNTIDDITEFVKSHKYDKVRKRSDSGFKKTVLEEVLRGLNARNVFLMGVNSSYCVLSTAIDAINRGFSISTSQRVISDTTKYIYNDTKRWYKEHCVFFEDDFRGFFPRMSNE